MYGASDTQKRRVCVHCGEPGHIAKNCEKARADYERTQKRRQPLQCNNCGQTGHKSSDCTNERQPKCKNCSAYGHYARECPDKKCCNCQETGHIARDCPRKAQATCHHCNEAGHTAKDCPRGIAVQCENCGLIGHTRTNCDRPQRVEDDAEWHEEPMSAGDEIPIVPDQEEPDRDTLEELEKPRVLQYGLGRAHVVWTDSESKTELFMPIDLNKIYAHSEYKAFVRVRGKIRCTDSGYGLVRRAERFIYLTYAAEDLVISSKETKAGFDLLQEFELPASAAELKEQHEARELTLLHLQSQRPALATHLRHPLEPASAEDEETLRMLTSLSKALDVKIICKKKDSLLAVAPPLTHIFLQHRKRGPYFKWRYQVNRKGKGPPTIQFNAYKKDWEGPVFRLPVHDTFKDLDEYLLMWATAIQNEHNGRAAQVARLFDWGADICVWPDLTSAKEGRYLRFFAFANFPSYGDTSKVIKIGDKISLFETTDDIRSKDYRPVRGTVLNQPTAGQDYDVCVSLDIAKDSILPTFLQDRNRWLPSVEKAAEPGHGFDCDAYIRVENSDRPARACFQALSSLASNPDLYKDVTPKLLGHDLGTSTVTNAFLDLAPDDEAKIKQKLRPDQQAFFNSLKEVPDRFHAVVGPPGTGKTFTLAHIVYANHLQGKQTVIAVPSNTAANVATRRIAEIFTSFGVSDVEEKIVRFEAPDLVSSKVKSAMRRKKPETTGPELHVDKQALMSDEDRENAITDPDAEQALKALFDGPNLPDPQLALDEVTAGLRSDRMEFSRDRRIAPDILKFTVPKQARRYIDSEKDGELTALYKQAVNSGFADTEEGKAQKKQFNDKLKKVPAVICGKASVIILTLTNCGSYAALIKGYPTVFEIKLSMVLIDDAGKCTEPETLCALSAFPHAALFIFCGDPRQLPPTVLTSDGGVAELSSDLRPAAEESLDHDEKGFNPETEGEPLPRNEVAQQLRQAFLLRLVERLLWPSRLLTIQSRCVEQIRSLWSRPIYDDRVHDAAGTGVQDRHLAQQFQRFAHDNFGFERCSFFAVTVRHAKHAREVNGMSLYNASYITIVHDMLDRLGKSGFTAQHIKVITPYRAEVRKIRERLRDLPQGGAMAWSEVSVTTVDSAQGDEQDIVILDLVAAGVSTSAMPFVEDWKRLNVAISRARNGLIIIGDPAVCRTIREFKDGELVDENGMSHKLRTSDLYPIIFAEARSRKFVYQIGTATDVTSDVTPHGAEDLEVATKAHTGESEGADTKAKVHLPKRSA